MQYRAVALVLLCSVLTFNMPPALIRPLQLAARGNAELLSALAEQWTRPADILSVLLLVGPDIVQKAVAQLSGRVITPVAFSFGWVAYSTSALMATFGDGKLMPNADVEGVLVMDTDSGHSRVTKNWVLGRLLRDMDDRLDGERTHEAAHVPPTIAAEIHAPPPPATATTPKHATLAKSPQQPWDALQITVYAVDKKPPVPHGIPVLDRVWYLGCTVIVVQLVIAMIPWILNGEWDTFLITGAGTLFALVGGSQSQWQSEKWACPKTGGASVVLTQGNGSRHAVVILNNRKDKTGLDLEILARGTRTSRASPITTAVSSVLAFAWIVLLITVAGFAGNSWCKSGWSFFFTFFSFCYYPQSMNDWAC